AEIPEPAWLQELRRDLEQQLKRAEAARRKAERKASAAQQELARQRRDGAKARKAAEAELQEAKKLRDAAAKVNSRGSVRNSTATLESTLEKLREEIHQQQREAEVPDEGAEDLTLALESEEQQAAQLTAQLSRRRGAAEASEQRCAETRAAVEEEAAAVADTKADKYKSLRIEEGDEMEHRLDALREDFLKLQDDETDLVEHIDLLTQAYHTRKDPLQKDLQQIRAKLHSMELEIWSLEHGEESGEAAPGPEKLSFVNGNAFGCLCSFVILANLTVMALEYRQGSERYQLLDLLFLGFYVVELVLKGAYFQKTLLCGKCSVVWWNWLDLIIVLSGVLEQTLVPLLGSSGSLPIHLSSLRCLRLLRLARVARALKLIKFLLRSDLSWTEHPAFETFMMVVIMINAIVMWLELDYPLPTLPVWTCVENTLLVIYVFELFVRVAFHGVGYFIHEDWAWHWLDFVVVMFGVLEQWMLPFCGYIYELATGSPSQTSVALPFLRLMRVTRVTRVLRLARLLRKVRPLYQLLNGVTASLQGVGWVILATFMLLYSAAIVFTTMVGRGYIYDNPDEIPEAAKENYATVARSFLTLFKLMNDDQSVVEPIVTTWIGQLLFYSFMMLSNWMALAILTSVVSDNMIAASRQHDEHETLHQKQLKQARAKVRLKQIFGKLDQNQDGCITEMELEQFLKDELQQQELCEAAGLHPADLVEVLYCTGYETKEGERRLLYRQFLQMLQDESGPVSERSIFKIMERLRAMEFRVERRLTAVLERLVPPNELPPALPSLEQELENAVAQFQREVEHAEVRLAARARGQGKAPMGELAELNKQESELRQQLRAAKDQLNQMQAASAAQRRQAQEQEEDIHRAAKELRQQIQALEAPRAALRAAEAALLSLNKERALLNKQLQADQERRQQMEAAFQWDLATLEASEARALSRRRGAQAALWQAELQRWAAELQLWRRRAEALPPRTQRAEVAEEIKAAEEGCLHAEAKAEAVESAVQKQIPSSPKPKRRAAMSEGPYQPLRQLRAAWQLEEKLCAIEEEERELENETEASLEVKSYVEQ
ncbi:unnamed protein product, partial [Effrenium voratum]